MRGDASILIVDDEPSVRRFASSVLEPHGFACASAGTVDEALVAIDLSPPQLVLTDFSMPGAPGIDLVRLLRESHPDIATVMVTGRDDPDLAEDVLDGGAYGYIVKPYQPSELLIAVSGALKRRALVLENRAHRDRLEQLVRLRTGELDESRAETVERLARAVEFRDSGTGEHIERMSSLVHSLACALGWEEQQAETLRLASILHDVGKIGIPDGLLRKPAPLTPDERAVMETHASMGHAILAGARSELLRLADVVAWTHHERFDGSGYPRGLHGEEIPLAGRIAAVADVFDALTSDRPYRAAMTEHEALDTIRGDSGFDPAIVDVLDGLVA